MKYARQCTITGEPMNSGWVIGDGEQYAKYEKGAIQIVKDMGFKSLQEAYDEDACYWTEWEEEDDYQYEMINGKLIEIDN